MKLIFLFLCLFVGVIFNAIPSDIETMQMFPLSDVAVTFKTWLYFVMEHGILIMLSYIIASEAKQYKVACKVFFYIQIFDLVDYLLTYNSAWTGIISYNIISMIIFGVFIMQEYDRRDYY